LIKNNLYLDLLEKFNIEPNFWGSNEYFEKANLKIAKKDNVIQVVDPNTNQNVFPPLDMRNGNFLRDFTGDVWSGLVGSENALSNNNSLTKKFLDYNFIYNPRSFLDISGGEWAVFRKNSRKFLNRNKQHQFQYINLSSEFDKGFYNIFIEWLENKNENEEIHDDEIILKYLEAGKNRKVLIDANNEIYGINIWDENFLYVNFRYCFCKPGQFLSEYMRLLFYIDPVILNKNKLVNDGGSLDNNNLYNFKMKLNPVKINKIYSYLRKGE